MTWWRRKDQTNVTEDLANLSGEKLYNTSMAAYDRNDLYVALDGFAKSVEEVIELFFADHPGRYPPPRLRTFGPFFNALDMYGKSLRKMNILKESEEAFVLAMRVAEEKDSARRWGPEFYTRLEAIQGRREMARKMAPFDTQMGQIVFAPGRSISGVKMESLPDYKLSTDRLNRHSRLMNAIGRHVGQSSDDPRRDRNQS